MAKPPKPTKVAMLICDHVIREAGSNKHTLIGVFDNMYSIQVPPISHARLAYYAKIANAEGEYDFEIQLVDLGSQEMNVLNSIKAHATAADRHLSVDFFFFFENIRFPRYGKYAFRLVMNGDYVGEVTLEMRPMTSRKA